MPQPGDILIVDDSGTNLFLLQRLLENEGYSVVITEDPQEGLEKVDTNRNINLILLDIMMPKIDGFKFMEKLSDKGEISRIPVIIVTAREDGQSQDKALNMGAVDYMTKPLNLKKVITTIRKHLD